MAKVCIGDIAKTTSNPQEVGKWLVNYIRAYSTLSRKLSVLAQHILVEFCLRFYFL